MALSHKWYQWVKGENIGRVIEWDGVKFYDSDSGMNLLIFKDGSRCNETMVGDYIFEIAGNSPEHFIILDTVNKDTNAQQQKTLNPVPVQTTPYDAQMHGANNANVQLMQIETQPPAVIVTPVYQILKDSKKLKSNATVDLVVDMPPAALMSVLAQTYDDGKDQILDFISNTLDIDSIKNQIAQQIWESAFTKETTNNYGGNYGK